MFRISSNGRFPHEFAVDAYKFRSDLYKLSAFQTDFQYFTLFRFLFIQTVFLFLPEFQSV